MKLLAFKLTQTLAIAIGWVVFSALAIVCAPLFLLWSSAGLLAHVWAFAPKKDRHA
jgi:hypothetical protein